MLDNDQEGVTGSNQWAPYSLGRRDVPPDNLMKKVRAFFFLVITKPLRVERVKGKNSSWGIFLRSKLIRNGGGRGCGYWKV